MEAELISIIIPVYNASKYLEDTIQTIKNQTKKEWEAIFVDDASTDNSAEIIKKHISPQIRLITLKKNHGAAYARNTGIKAAKGRFLCYLDADDLWHRDKLKKQYEFMKDKYAFSFTAYEFADENGRGRGKIVSVPQSITYRQALVNTVISTVTVMLDREKISDDVIMMPLNAAREDTASWWMILKNGYTAYGLNEVLSYYRRHSGSDSSNKLKAVMGTWRMYRQNEGLSVIQTLNCFTKYIFRAIKRRL